MPNATASPKKWICILRSTCPQCEADVLVANILGRPTGGSCSDVREYLETGGLMALSGILDGQEDELLARYEEGSTTLQSSSAMTGCESAGKG